MKIPYGFEYREIDEQELRSLQIKNLDIKKEFTKEDRRLIDAVLSYFIVNILRGK